MQNFWGLFIGVNCYKGNKWGFRDLVGAENDAKALRDFFLEIPGVAADRMVLCVGPAGTYQSPSSNRIRTCLSYLMENAQPDDRLLLFFAGHGVEWNGRHWLLAQDSHSPFQQDSKFEETSISVAHVRDELRRKFSSVVMILDACRKEPFAGRGLSANPFANRLGGLEFEGDRHTRGWAVLAACDEGQESLENRVECRGLFTSALLRCLRDFSAAPPVTITQVQGCLKRTIQVEIARLEEQYPGERIVQQPRLILDVDDEPVLIPAPGRAKEPGYLFQVIRDLSWPIKTRLGLSAPVWKRKLFLAAISFIVCGLMVIYWFIHDSHCGRGMTITSPVDGAPVSGDELFRGTRTPREWLCRCKDFLIIEPVGLRMWYVQDRLLDGPDWNLSARFGDSNTPDGTRFNVFVLSATKDLPRGPISPSSKLIDGARPSKSVQVTLKHLAAWIRISNTADLSYDVRAEQGLTRESLKGTLSGTASSGHASIFVLYRVIKDCFHSKLPVQGAAKGASIPTCEARYPETNVWKATEAIVDASGNWTASIEPQDRRFEDEKRPWLEFWQFQAVAVPDREDFRQRLPPWHLIAQETLDEIRPKRCSESVVFSPFDSGYYRSFWPTILKSACGS